MLNELNRISSFEKFLMRQTYPWIANKFTFPFLIRLSYPTNATPHGEQEGSRGDGTRL